MRILHVTPYYEDAWAYGGIPRLAGALARGLVRRGHQVTVCTTDACDERGRLPRRANVLLRGGVRVRVFANLSNHAAYHLGLFVPLGLTRYLTRRSGSFDVAHLHGFHNLLGVVAARCLAVAGVPYVLAPNGTAPLIERRQAAKWIFDRTLGHQVMPGAARVLAVTEVERRQLRSLGVDDARLRVLPNPVDLSEYDDDNALSRGRFRRRLGLGAHHRLVLYLGRWTPRKRLDVVVRAARRVCAGDADARLVIAGNDMGCGPALRRQVRRSGFQDRVALVPLLRGRARLEALADADVVVYPGADEIFGLVVLESLLCGTPVLVADDCGAAELIGRTGGGMALPVGDDAALADGIQQVLARPEAWQKRTRDAIPLVREAFGPDTVCAQLEGLYREVLGEKHEHEHEHEGRRP